MAQFQGDFNKPVLGSTPAKQPDASISPAYPPNQGLTNIPSALTIGAALQFASQDLGGLTTEIESNPTITGTVGIVAEGNGDRVGLVIVNQGLNDIFIGLSQAVSSTNGIRLSASGGNIAMDVRHDYTLLSRRWWAITAGGASLVYVLEEVRITLNPMRHV